jgi:DNA-binding NarL/FixJ family response regulator
MKPRILLVDQHLLVVDALTAVLWEAAYHVVGSAGDASEAVACAKRVVPDIVLTEILLQNSNGLEATRCLTRVVPGAKVIFVSDRDSRLWVDAALEAGAWGYVLKRSAPAELFHAIESVLAGRRYITPLVRTGPSQGPVGDALPPNKLTRRQQQVLELSSEGMTIGNMASILNVSTKTIEYHKSNLMRELNVRRTSKLIQYGLCAADLVSLPSAGNSPPKRLSRAATRRPSAR